MFECKERYIQRWARDLCVPVCPHSLIFPLRSAFLYNIFFAFPCAPAFLFRIPSVCVGVGEQLITRACVWTDQAGRVNSPLRLYPPPPRHACVLYESTGGKPV